MLKLKLQYFGHLMWRADSFGKTLMLGKIEGRRRRGWQRMTWLDDTTNSMDMGLGRLRELVMDREARSAVVHGVTKTWLSDWTELNWTEAEVLILWPPDAKNRLTEKVLMLGKIEGKRRRGQERMRWLNSITNSMDINLSKFQETVKDMEVWHAVVHGVAKSRTRTASEQLNWYIELLVSIT